MMSHSLLLVGCVALTASTANAFTMQDAKTVLSSTSTFFKTAMASVSSRQRRGAHVISSESGSGDISTTPPTEAPTTTFGENGDGRDECRALCQTVADQTNAVSPGAGDGVLEQCDAYCALSGEMGDIEINDIFSDNEIPGQGTVADCEAYRALCPTSADQINAMSLSPGAGDAVLELLVQCNAMCATCSSNCDGGVTASLNMLLQAAAAAAAAAAEQQKLVACVKDTCATEVAVCLSDATCAAPMIAVMGGAAEAPADKEAAFAAGGALYATFYMCDEGACNEDTTPETPEPAPTYETFVGVDADSETKPECVASGVGSNATPSKEAFLSDFTEILEHNCNGELSIMGGHELFKMRFGMSNLQNTIGGGLVAHLNKRLNQLCPGASSDPEVGNSVTPSITAAFSTILAGATAKKAEAMRSKLAAYCATGAGDAIELYTYFDAASAFAVKLPSSCDPVAYATDGCKMQYKFTEKVFGGAAIQLAMKECPGKVAPYISLTCDGHMCQDLLKPCNSDTDCKGSVCGSVKTVMDDLGVFGDGEYDDDFEEAMESLSTIAQFAVEETGVVEENQKGCNGGATVGEDVAKAAMQGFNSLYTSRTEQLDDFKMCGLGDMGTVLDCAVNAQFPDPFEGCQIYDDDGDDINVQCDDKNLQAWDGKLADGSDVFGAGRLSPTPLGTAPASCTTNAAVSVPVIHSQCDGTNTLSPGSPFAPSMQLPLPHVAMSKFITPILDIVAKAANQCAALSPDDQGLRWDAYRPPMWMQMLTTNNQRIEQTDEVSGSIYDLIQRQMFGGEDCDGDDSWKYNCENLDNDKPEENKLVDRMEMPNGCTLADYLTTGECKLQWSGMKKVLSSHPVTFRATLSDCPGSYPSLYVDCVDDENGDVCRDLIRIYDITTCATNADCKYGECQDVGEDVVEDVLNVQVDPVTKLVYDALAVDGECQWDYKCCSGVNSHFGVSEGGYNWHFVQEENKQCFKPYDDYDYAMEQIKEYGYTTEEGATCVDGSDRNGKAWDCQPYGSAADLDTVENTILSVVGRLSGTAAKTWAPGGKGVCFPTLVEDVDLDSMYAYKAGVDKYMFGAEIFTVTDLEPYRTKAGDTCASDVASGVTPVFVAPTADPAEVAAAAEARNVAELAVVLAQAGLDALLTLPNVDPAVITAAEFALASAKAALSSLEAEHANLGLLDANLDSSAASTHLVNVAAVAAALLCALVM